MPDWHTLTRQQKLDLVATLQTRRAAGAASAPQAIKPKRSSKPKPNVTLPPVNFASPELQKLFNSMPAGARQAIFGKGAKP